METNSTRQHSIGIASRRSGLSPDLIRAWERRYGAVRPRRTKGRHRLYSDQDIDRLVLLRQVSLTWRRIGKIADLSNAALRQLLAQEKQFEVPTPETEGETVDARSCVKASLQAILSIDAQGLRRLLEDAWVNHGHETLLAGVLAPLLNQIGEMWRLGGLRIMHEHLASQVIHSLLLDLAAAYPRPSDGPTFCAATLADQRHEIGALFALAVAASARWNAVYLGPDLPALELAAAARDLEARAIGLSMTHPFDENRIHRELRALWQEVGPQVDILVGGGGARSLQERLKTSGASYIVDLGHLHTVLSQLVDVESPSPGDPQPVMEDSAR